MSAGEDSVHPFFAIDIVNLNILPLLLLRGR